MTSLAEVNKDSYLAHRRQLMEKETERERQRGHWGLRSCLAFPVPFNTIRAPESKAQSKCLIIIQGNSMHCLYRLTLKRKSPSLLLFYIVAQNKVVMDSKGGCFPNEATFVYLLTSAFLLKNVMWAANHLNTTLKLQRFSFIRELGQLQHFGSMS